MVDVGTNSSDNIRVLLNLSDSFTWFSGHGGLSDSGDRLRLLFLDNSKVMISNDTGST